MISMLDAEPGHLCSLLVLTDPSDAGIREKDLSGDEKSP